MSAIAEVHELCAKFDKVRSAVRNLKIAREKEVELVEMNANLEFIGLLKGDKPPSLDAEAEFLNELKLGLVGADVRFDEVSAELLVELGLPPLSPEPSLVPPPDFDVEAVEKVAVKIGVADPHGSNITESVSIEEEGRIGDEQVSGETTPIRADDGEPGAEKTAADISS